MKETLYEMILKIIDDEWMETPELRKRVWAARPATTKGSISRTLTKMIDYKDAIRQQCQVTGSVRYQYKLNPNPPKERPARPVRTIGRPKIEEIVEQQGPQFILPKGTVRVTHNARNWTTVEKMTKPPKYCQTQDGRFFRIRKHNEGNDGFTPITEIHIKTMAKERVYG